MEKSYSRSSFRSNRTTIEKNDLSKFSDGQIDGKNYLVSYFDIQELS